MRSGRRPFTAPRRRPHDSLLTAMRRRCRKSGRTARYQSSLPSDLDDLDAGLLGARDHVGGAATAGKGQYDIWLLVEHHLIALRPGRGAPFLPVGRHADESDFLGGGLPVSPALPLIYPLPLSLRMGGE